MRNLPKVIAITGILLATAAALYPRWDRTWTLAQRVQSPGDHLGGWGKSEKSDVVRHFLLTDPPSPQPAPNWQYGEATVSQEVLGHAAHVQLGRTLLEWFLVAVPALLIAVILNQRGSVPGC